MKIYAPSFKRAKGVKTHKIIPEVIYCVHEFEAEEYKKLGYNIQVMPDSIKGNIARVRNYILENYTKQKCLIIDDDIEAIKRWNLKDGKPKQEKIENIHEWIEQCFNMAEESGTRLWGVNILGDKGSYREYHGNLGGCADYRTMSREKDQLTLLQKKWGKKIVKLDTTQRGKKTKNFDLNPIIKAPIKGI
mgnify:CR=1 FL=1